MSPFQIDVHPDVFDAASKVFGQTVANAIAAASKELGGALGGTGGMAGTDPGGTQWADAYDPAAASTLGVLTDLTNASYKLAAMLERTGFNHGTAESHSDPTRSVPTPADTTRYPLGQAAAPPSVPSAHGGSGGAPPGWDLVQSAVGYVWPDGDTGKLHTAASAWKTAAESLDFASYDVDEAVQAVRSQHSPEIGHATTVCHSMKGHIADGADLCRILSASCTDLADHIDKAHNDIKDELVSLLEWTAAIEVGGGLLSLVSFGAAEIPTQAAEAGRIAKTAASIGAIIARLIDFASTAAASVSAVTSRVAAVSQRLKVILGARLTAVTAKLTARLPKLGKTAETEAETALETAATEADWLAATKGKLPSDWGKGVPNRKGVGNRWQDPENPGNGVRIDRGDPNNTQVTQQADHVVVRRNGQVIGRDGKPLTGSLKDNAEMGHIPLEEWATWTHWYGP